MTRAIVALIAVSLAVALTKCGDQGDEVQNGGLPGVRVVLEADVNQLPPDTDIDDVMREVAEILERRITAFDTGDFEIEVEGTNRLSVRLRGIGIEEARELLGKTAQLEFRKPVLDESRDIICETEDGSTYAQPYQPGLFVEDETNDTVTCPPNEEGTTGIVQWEPATGTDSQGADRVLTGGLLRPNAKVVGPPPTVAIEFTGEGSLLFEQITTELVGLPLGIFLDEDLIGAPRVSQPITGGNATITGLSEDEARVLAIQLNTGALPVPLRAVLEEVYD